MAQSSGRWLVVMDDVEHTDAQREWIRQLASRV